MIKILFYWFVKCMFFTMLWRTLDLNVDVKTNLRECLSLGYNETFNKSKFHKWNTRVFGLFFYYR